MNTRIKELRKAIKLNQETFATRIGLTKNYISLVENGERTPSERTINDICREFNVSKEWLLNGTGEMFVVRTTDELLTDFLADVLNEDDGEFKREFIARLAKLPVEKWQLIADLVDALTKDRQ